MAAGFAARVGTTVGDRERVATHRHDAYHPCEGRTVSLALPRSVARLSDSDQHRNQVDAHPA
jgi:hypothetical protein